MLYQVSRDGQFYGPYTLEDLQRYVASGNVLLTDLAKSESMQDWIPVSQVLTPGQPSTQAAYAHVVPEPAYGIPTPGMQPAYDAPPNLNWLLVLLFAFLTCSLFMYIWNLILAAWANRAVPGSKVLLAYIAATVMVVLQVFSGARANMSFTEGMQQNGFHFERHGVYFALIVVSWVARLIARFTMRSTLEQYYNTVDPIGLRLSGVMTFFFGGLYFQYHINRINELKRAMLYGRPGF